jgi:hypothetical protein
MSYIIPMQMYIEGKDDPIETFSSPRIFRLWHMMASHHTMLIRSERYYDDPESENIDLFLNGTTYVQIPQILNGVEITAATPAEIKHLNSRLNLHESQQDDVYFEDDVYFVLVSEGMRYYIRAANLLIFYNKKSPTQNPYTGQQEPEDW